MSKPSDPKAWSADPLLILIAGLLLLATVATLYFAFNGPAKEFTHEPAARLRPVIQDEPRVVVVTKTGTASPAAHATAHAAAGTAGHAPAEEKPAEAKPAEAKPAAPAVVTVAAPVVKPGADGKVRGKVVLRGTPPAEKPFTPIKSDKNCGPAHPGALPTTRNYVAAADGGLRYVLVRIVNAPAGAGQAPAQALIDQLGCMYEPYVSAVLAGQPFKVKNSDAFMHNVNAGPKVNKGFNFAQANAGQVNEKTFDKPELAIKFVCNVHPWMSAFVHVLEHPFFAVTDDKGEFVLPDGLPPGRYTLEANHLKAGVVTAEIEVAAGKGAEVAFEFGVK